MLIIVNTNIFHGVYTGDYAEAEIDKNEMLQNFKEHNINIMHATKAFGMGVDIKDIANVYHYAVTGNLSDYLQEIGRAARKEGMEGRAIIDYFENDLKYMNSLFRNVSDKTVSSKKMFIDYI